MEMFLMVLSMSIFGLAITAAAFGAATRPEQSTKTPHAPPEPVPLTPVTAPRFFVDHVVTPSATQPRVPIEALLLRIENHVRLEQAAAESFLDSPTAALLHSKTISQLIQ